MNLELNTPQFLFDDTWVTRQRRLVRRWLPATVHPRPVLEPDQPWEGRSLVLYGTVLPAPEGGYRLYYSNYTPGKASAIGLATSVDGLHWLKPDLGLVAWQGSSANNIVLAPERINDAPSLLHDPGDPTFPYKLALFEMDDPAHPWNPSWGTRFYGSADGLRWQPLAVPILPAGDRSALIAERVDGRIIHYTRHPRMFELAGARAIYRTTCSNLNDWDALRLVLAPDLTDEPDVEYYGMCVFRRHGWYLGLLEYWRSAVDVIEVHLVWSHDGITWLHPTPRAPFIAASYDWNRAWSSCASNGPIFIGDQMVFYLGGRWASHSWDAAKQYGAIGIASLAADRYCALESTTGGELLTVPFTWPGGELALNADTRESYTSHPAMCEGEITVEVLDEATVPLPGWSGAERALFRGNTHARGVIQSGRVVWPGQHRLDELRGQVICLRFGLRHARLFTFRADTSLLSTQGS